MTVQSQFLPVYVPQSVYAFCHALPNVVCIWLHHSLLMTENF